MTIVYHASPNINLSFIDPNRNNERKVFAAKHLDMAYAFLGRAGRGYVMGQMRDHGIPLFTELCDGAFEYRYRRVPGAIYLLNAENFKSGGWQEEVTSEFVETPIAPPIIVPDIRSHLEQMERSGHIVIRRWTGRTDDQGILDHWLGFATNPRYHRPSVIQEATAFIQDMRPHLLPTFQQQLNNQPR